MKIRRLPSGNYNARVEITGAGGKRKWKSITAPDKITVRKLIAEYESRQHDGKQQTLAQCMEAYLAAKKPILSPYTVKGYQNIIGKIKGTDVGELPADMTRSEAQRIVTAFADLSPKTIRNRIGLISAAVRFAGYAFPAVTLPQRKKAEIYTPTKEDMEKVVAAAAGTELEIPITLGMMGLRRGEICGIKGSDISGTRLHIRRAAVDIGGEVTMKTPKTYESDRVITLPESVAKKIRAAGRATDLSPEQLSYHFITFLKKQDVPHFRFHDLRHFFASYCHNVLKMSDAQIQKLGGWKTDHVMKRVYIASMEDTAAASAAAEGIGDIIG